MNEDEDEEPPDRTGAGMLRRWWTDVGIVERYLHQSYPVILAMTAREFRFHVVTACYWRWKEIDSMTQDED